MALLGTPVGFAMLAAGFAYMFATGQDVGLVVDQVMNSLYQSYVLIAVPLFIFVANMMSAGGVIDRMLDFAGAVCGRFRGGLAYVNVVANLIFSGMSGSAVADAAGPGLVVSRMMIRDGRYGAGFAAATSAASATIGPIVPPSIPMIFYALIANTSVAAMFLAGLVPAGLMAAALIVAVAIIARRRGLPASPPPPLACDPLHLCPRGAAAAAAGAAARASSIPAWRRRPRRRRSPRATRSSSPASSTAAPEWPRSRR